MDLLSILMLLGLDMTLYILSCKLHLLFFSFLLLEAFLYDYPFFNMLLKGLYLSKKKSKFWKSGLKLLYLDKNKHFLFNKYWFTYTLKLFPADKTDSSLVFANIHQTIFAWPLCDIHVFIKLSAKIIVNHIQTYRRII